jgi:hypothetical protein
MERIALALPARPGGERALARLVAPSAGGGTVFLAPGLVVCVADAAAGVPPVPDGRLRELCRVPEGQPTAAFLARARLARRAHYRRPDPPEGPVHRRALLYPVRPGRGPRLCRLLTAGVAPATPHRLASALVGSTVYARGDTVLRYWEATAAAEDELDNITRVVPRSPLGAALNRLLDFPADLTTADGFRAFFTSCAMSAFPGAPGGGAAPAAARAARPG